MEITITYATKRKFGLGFKLTGRDGQKGVACQILPDKYMPVDDYGVRADLVIDPISGVKRMTMGPLYEPAINRTSEFVRRKIEEIYPQNPKAAWDILIDYLNDINPNYAMHVCETMATDRDKDSLLQESINNHITLHIPPGLNTINPALIQKLKTKWNVPLSPVTFTQCDTEGSPIATFRTKANVCIGSKYVFLLCKIPEPSSACVAKISQFNTPMKANPSDRSRYPIKPSPIRTGEDENRIINMDMEDPREQVRMMCMQGGSPKGVNLMVEQILNNPQPTKIERMPITTGELIDSNTIVQIFHHQLATMGVGISRHGPTPIHSELLKEVKS